MTGTTSTGTEDDINALFFEFSGNFRSCFIHKFLHVSAAAHEGVGFCREGTDEAFFYQFMKTVDREHGIDIFVDIGVIEASVCNHQHIGRGVKRDRTIRKISGCIEWCLIFAMDTAGCDKCDFTFTQWLL